MVQTATISVQSFYFLSCFEFNKQGCITEANMVREVQTDSYTSEITFKMQRIMTHQYYLIYIKTNILDIKISTFSHKF